MCPYFFFYSSNRTLLQNTYIQTFKIFVWPVTRTPPTVIYCFEFGFSDMKRSWSLKFHVTWLLNFYLIRYLLTYLYFLPYKLTPDSVVAKLRHELFNRRVYGQLIYLRVVRQCPVSYYQSTDSVPIRNFFKKLGDFIQLNLISSFIGK